MSNWKPIETAPRNRCFLAREGCNIYKCKIFLNDEDGVAWYESYTGQEEIHKPEPEEWCEIPE